MVLDAYGSILIHPDQDLVTLNAAQGRSLSTSLLGMLTAPEDATEVRGVMSDARQAPGEVMMLKVAINGAPRLLALSWIPELQWFVASVVDLSTAQVIELRPLLPAIALFVLLIVALIGGGAWLVEKRVLKPLRQLRRSAQALAAGEYGAPLPTDRDDEIGELSAAFGAMAQQVRRHTHELEDRVRERNRPTAKWPPRTRRSTTRSTTPASSSAPFCPIDRWSVRSASGMPYSGGRATSWAAISMCSGRAKGAVCSGSSIVPATACPAR